MATSDNKRIAKNAAALYIRMIVTMLIGLYTSRVILNALGVTDYGIYGVVGGFVAMFSIISSSISASISRFLTFELGRGNVDNLKHVFSTSILVLTGLAIIVVGITETVGLWYLYNKMVIPPDRLKAAFWCFQFSLLSMVFTLINMPYKASILAHERMDIYAYMAILEAVLKLAICFIVLYSPVDRLVIYAALTCFVSILNQIIYLVFCKRKFEECRFRYVLKRDLFKSMFSFAGWNFIGSSASILYTQGSNVLLNWAGGPVVNASYGIANNASGMISSFVNNFTQAFNPQITKRYAAGEYQSLMQLLVYGAKYSYLLMFIISLPVMLNAEFLIRLWLGEVPEYTVPFIRCIILANLFDAISRPIVTAKCATGSIRNYQIVVGGILLLILPLSYIAIELGFSVISVTVITAIISLVSVFARMYMMRNDFPGWSSLLFMKKVVLVLFYVSLISLPIPILTYVLLPSGWINLVCTTTVCLITISVSYYLIGCNTSEREQLKKIIIKLVRKLIRKKA